ncbi:hypothetical protein M885DRAFT_560810 [Pelagophyceae sp. CCMP2097]|nr:hypothetical protein M885DRAFT_560810 [Pelagophyceae sp. CCMP2097]
MALASYGALAAPLEAARFAATAHATAVDALERAFDAGMAQLATDRLALEGDRSAFIAETEEKLARGWLALPRAAAPQPLAAAPHMLAAAPHPLPVQPRRAAPPAGPPAAAGLVAALKTFDVSQLAAGPPQRDVAPVPPRPARDVSLVPTPTFDARLLSLLPPGLFVRHLGAATKGDVHRARAAGARPTKDETFVARGDARKTRPKALLQAFERFCDVVRVDVCRTGSDVCKAGSAFVFLRTEAACEAAKRMLHATRICGNLVSVIRPLWFALNRELCRARSCQAVFHLASKWRGSLSEVNLATAVHRLGALAQANLLRGAAGETGAVRDEAGDDDGASGEAGVSADGDWHRATDDLFREASASLGAKVWSARRLANVVLGAAKLQTCEGAALFFGDASKASCEALLQKVTSVSVLKLRAFTSQGLANLIWGLAKAHRFYDGAFQNIGHAFLDKLEPRTPPQELSNVVWAFATARIDSPEVFRAIADHALKHDMQSFNPQDASKPLAMYDALCARALEHLEAFEAQHLSTLAWALAHASEASARLARPQVLRLLAAEALVPRKIALFKPRDVTMMAWAYATLGIQAPDLQPAAYWALSTAAQSDMADFTPREMADVTWAFAVAGACIPDLFSRVAVRAALEARRFQAASLAKLAWAFTAAGFQAPKLFRAIAIEARRKIGDFDAQNLANTAWAFATAGVSSPALFSAIATEAVENGRIHSFDAQNLANCTFAFVVSEGVADETHDKLSEFHPEEVSQLYQVYIHLRLFLPENNLTRLLAHFVPELHAAFVREQAYSGMDAKRSVSDALCRCFWLHDARFVTDDGAWLDAAQPEERRAVDFDGPSHYLVPLQEAEPRCQAPRHSQSPAAAGGLFSRAPPLPCARRPRGSAHSARVLDGKALFKDRLVKRLGWDLLRVPFFEWDGLRSTTAQEEYLTRRLKHRGFDVKTRSAPTETRQR